MFVGMTAYPAPAPQPGWWCAASAGAQGRPPPTPSMRHRHAPLAQPLTECERERLVAIEQARQEVESRTKAAQHALEMAQAQELASKKQAAERQRLAVASALRTLAERQRLAVIEKSRQEAEAAEATRPPRAVGPIGPWSFSARTPVAAPVATAVTVAKEKRRAPPKKIRDKVWKNSFGDALGGKCVCCSAAIDIAHWECAHILASKEGGLDAEDNLLPSCRSCNRSMGTENLWAFKARCYPNH